MRRANPNTTEPALAPAFQKLLATLLGKLPAAPQLVVAPELRNAGLGRPDVALIRQGQIARLRRIEGVGPSRWRDPTTNAQYERFRELATCATSNFGEPCLFLRGDEIDRAVIVPSRG